MISIITPVYNAEKHLSKMLDSVIKQSYKEWELILVNDGSTDNSAQIIKAYLSKDDRIRFFSQSNAGPSMARNKGVANAKGTYLSFIDADDWITQDYLHKLINPMLNHSTDLVCAGYYEINPQFPLGLKLHDFKKEQFNQNLDKQTYQTNVFKGVSGVLWAKLFKSQIFIENDIQFHPELRLSEDLIAVLEYSFHIQRAYILPDSIYYYNRLAEDSLSGRSSINHYKGLILLIKEIKKLKNEIPFLDLDVITNKRKYSFMIQLLKDHSFSKHEFYKTADFLVENESPLDPNIFQNNKINDQVLKAIFQGNYFYSWSIMKTYLLLKRIKNG